MEYLYFSEFCYAFETAIIDFKIRSLSTNGAFSLLGIEFYFIMACETRVELVGRCTVG